MPGLLAGAGGMRTGLMLLALALTVALLIREAAALVDACRQAGQPHDDDRRAA